jgi:hypothetical protein
MCISREVAMFKVTVYTDGPTVPDRDDVVKMAVLHSSSETPQDITEGSAVRYKAAALNLTDIQANGTTISPMVFFNNIGKFTYANGSLTFTGSALDGDVLTDLDGNIPLSCLRANTIVNFGRL